MTNLARISPDSPLPIPSGTEVEVALAAFQRALAAGVEIAKTREDGKTERELILAQKEMQIAAIEKQTENAIAHDHEVHENRRVLIRMIGQLITENAQNLTPEIMEAARLLLDALREER